MDSDGPVQGLPVTLEQALARSLASFKLRRWEEAEGDASRALELIPDDGVESAAWKLYYRRGATRRELGRFREAEQDLLCSLEAGAGRSVARELAELRYLLSAASTSSSYLEGTSQAASSPASTFDSHCGSPCDSTPPFFLNPSPGKQSGLFANRPLRRGELISSEPPLFTVPDLTAVVSKSATLSPSSLATFYSLANAFSDRHRALGTFETNAFGLENGAAALFPVAARFNHSCAPSAKASWHAPSGCLRVFALQDIAVGEEIFTSYIGQKQLYGATRKSRRGVLEFGWNFVCTCVVCSLEGDELRASDRRRLSLAAIGESLPRFEPVNAEAHLRASGRALKLLEEEGYSLDSEEFASNAASVCAYHSDWSSASRWGRLAWEASRDQYGGDHRVAKGMKELEEDPRRFVFAGKGVYCDLRKVTDEALGRFNETEQSKSAWSFGLGLLGFGSSE